MSLLARVASVDELLSFSRSARTLGDDAWLAVVERLNTLTASFFPEAQFSGNSQSKHWYGAGAEARAGEGQAAGVSESSFGSRETGRES